MLKSENLLKFFMFFQTVKNTGCLCWRETLSGNQVLHFRLPQASSAPQTEEGDGSSIYLSGLKAHHPVTEINQDTVCQLRSSHVCLQPNRNRRFHSTNTLYLPLPTTAEQLTCVFSQVTKRVHAVTISQIKGSQWGRSCLDHLSLNEHTSIICIQSLSKQILLTHFSEQ